MPRLHPSLVLRALGRGLGALLSLVIGVLTRSALGIFTLLLMLYFAVNEPSMAARILGLVSEAIPGEIHARRIAWEPFRGRIHVLGVEISRPGGVPVIRAGRVTTDLRLGALLGHLVSPGEEPLPLIFDQTLVSEAEVNLEFREGKLLLVEAFVPPEASPPPKGRGTLLRMSDIRIEGARVRLEFEERWGVVVRDTTLDGEVRLEDRIITVRTRDLTASRVLLTGDPGLPRALVDAARGLRDLRVSRFQLRDREIDLAGVGIRGTAWELRAGGALAFPRGATRTVAASVALQVPDPEVLEKVTGGAVAGPFEASVVARGPLAAAQLGLSARSPRLEILGVPFDGVVAEARLGLGAPTFLRILALDARTGPGGISGRDLLVHLGSGPDERVRIGGRVDLEGVAGAALVEAFTGTDLEALSPVLAGSLSGRVGLRDLRIGDRAVRGSFSLDLAAGTEPDPRFGLGGAWSVTGELSLDGGGLHTPGLEVLTGEARVALSGALRWSPEPGLDLEGSLEVPGLGRHLAPLGVPGVDGDLSLDRVRVSGSLAHPEVSLAGTVAGLVVPGASGNLEISRLDLSGSPALPRVRLEAAVEGLRTPLLSLARVALDARLEEGSLVVQRLAWEDPLTDGAITGRVYGLVGPGPVIRRSPWRVAVENEAPLRLPLDLVAPEAGIAGDLRVDSFMADGRIGTRARHLLRDLRVASEAEVTGLATPAGGAREARVQLAAEARTAGGRGEPRIRGSVQVQAEGVDVAGVTVEALEASLTAGEVPLRLDWTVPSRVEGDLLLQARGLRRGFLAFRDLDLDLHYPAGEDASIHGRLQVTRGVGARVEGHVARADLRGHAQLRFDGMPLRQIPLPRNAAGAADLVREALVTGQVRLDWPALQPLLDLPTRGLLARLRLAGDLAATRLETLPEPLAGASASLDLQGGRLELRDLRVEHASGATLHGRARLNLEAMTGSGTLRWTPVALRSLRTLAALGLPLDARVGGDLSFRGPLARPHLEADVEIQALEAAGMRLGDAILSVQGDVGDTIRVSSDSFFDGLTLQNEAFLRMDGLDPVSAEADLAFHDLTLARVLPGRELPVTAGVTGSAHLE
ncbi:MAG: hypothetical protein FJ098_02750, partial [Deltaproteobacteria bacterium]|nr:hypothetical protein [Deltaproteobacteria bacterium]